MRGAAGTGRAAAAFIERGKGPPTLPVGVDVTSGRGRGGVGGHGEVGEGGGIGGP